MPTHSRNPALLAGLCAALALAGPARAAAQEGAVLRGIVADAGTGLAVSGARVILVGSGLETRSGSDGSFSLSAVPLGRHFLRVQSDRYPAVVEGVEVSADQELFVPVFLESVAAVLEELPVFADRSQRASEKAATTAADLLALQVPEIRTFASVAGRKFPTSLDLRGRGSFAGGEPLVVVDGVRFSGGVGQAMDRLRQIAAADVKSIRILQGPSSSFLYGAPHGVIYVQTHAGTPMP